MQNTFDALCAYARETALLESSLALVEWDERTKLPKQGASYRVEQIGCLSKLVHARKTAPILGEWLGELKESPLAADKHSDAGATVHHLLREYEQQKKLPASLVEELSRAAAQGQQIWDEARRANDFAAFAPVLARIVDLSKRKAEALQYAEKPYDALLDLYEPDETSANVDRVLKQLRAELVPLLNEIQGSNRTAPVDILKRDYPLKEQEAFGIKAAEQIGFDFACGRLDVAHHPFCTTIGPRDIRITTRYDEQLFSSSFFSVLHEAGHGIYEQGLRGDQFGLAPGMYLSLGIHESQSRLWENQVGRSRAFWSYFFPPAQQMFPAALGNVSLEEFIFAINHVEPSLIRVEADEVTYNLHIIIRFELEQALINDGLPVDELPTAWNSKYKEYLGIEPPHDADGVMQDVHWSAALIGYFPTYSLGNLYAAQLFHQASDELGDLNALFVQGDFNSLRDWLRTRVHQSGRCYSAKELIERVTGQAISHAPLISQLRNKLAPLYGLA